MKLVLWFLCIFPFSLHAGHNCSTRYPIVLSHGLFGYGGSLGTYSYWSDVPKTLRACGATVFIAHVSQANSTEQRGEQLYKQLQEWGYEKYNLIGHSHGGLDSRYVLENYPEIVASVSTIGTPHRGSKVADRLMEKLSLHTFASYVSTWFGNVLGFSIGLLTGHINWQNAWNALQSLTTPALNTFNMRYPHGLSSIPCGEGPYEYQGKKLYSWGSYGAQRTNFYDWFGRLMERASQVFPAHELNDGLVGICSMKFGKWLGAIPNAHHLLPVGGVVSPLPEALLRWPETMFTKHALRLQTAGL